MIDTDELKRVAKKAKEFKGSPILSNCTDDVIKYYATVNTTTILALISELEQARERVKELEKRPLVKSLHRIGDAHR